MTDFMNEDIDTIELAPESANQHTILNDVLYKYNTLKDAAVALMMAFDDEKHTTLLDLKDASSEALRKLRRVINQGDKP